MKGVGVSRAADSTVTVSYSVSVLIVRIREGRAYVYEMYHRCIIGTSRLERNSIDSPRLNIYMYVYDFLCWIGSNSKRDKRGERV